MKTPGGDTSPPGNQIKTMKFKVKESCLYNGGQTAVSGEIIEVTAHEAQELLNADRGVILDDIDIHNELAVEALEREQKRLAGNVSTDGAEKRGEDADEKRLIARGVPVTVSADEVAGDGTAEDLPDLSVSAKTTKAKGK